MFQSELPRTLLQQLIRQRALSYEEVAERLEAFARGHRIDAAIGARHLQRLARRERARDGELPAALPGTRRLLSEFFGHPFEALVSPSHAMPADDGLTGGALDYSTAASTSVELLAQLSDADLTDRTDATHTPWALEAPRIITDYLLETSPDQPRGRPLHGGRVSPVAARIQDFTATLIDLDYRYGGGHIRELVLQFFRSQVLPELRASHPESVRRQIFDAAARAAQLVGWASYDAGRHGLAGRYFVQGLRLAREAHDDTLGALLLANLSHQANFLRRGDDAVKFARAAQHAVGCSGSKTVVAKLLAMEARGLATLGDERACSRILRQAEQTFEQRDPSTDPPWITSFTEAELASEAAHCFRDLGLAAQAKDFAAEATDPTQTPPRTQAFVQMITAAAALRQGDLDEAVAVATSSVEGSGALQSNRYLSYVADFQAALADTHPNDPVASDFLARVRGTLPELVRTPPLAALGP